MTLILGHIVEELRSGVKVVEERGGYTVFDPFFYLFLFLFEQIELSMTAPPRSPLCVCKKRGNFFFLTFKDEYASHAHLVHERYQGCSHAPGFLVTPHSVIAGNGTGECPSSMRMV